MLFLIFAISVIIGDRGVRVIFACESYIKVPITAMSTFIQNEELLPTSRRYVIKYICLEGGGNL